MPAPAAAVVPARSVRGAGAIEGQAIGPYRIVALLGEGGFGSVYLADQDAPVRRRVALKMIKPGMDSRAVIARFEAERQALAVMDHPGIATVFDAGMTEAAGQGGGRPYFVMEYVKGEPITRFCEQERLGLVERVRLMIRVCEAVQHAHQKGIIHRDLKPSNILVELADGDPPRPSPKIIDFGVAKALTQRLTDTPVFTEHGQMIGTPEYMAPEQARGSAVDVDTRADVYSLGAILYELLTGLTPLDSATLRSGGYAEAQRAIEELRPIRPSERVSREAKSAATAAHSTPITIAGDAPRLSRRLRGDLDWIVMKCLEKERARRYDSASGLARDLERFLADQPVEAGPPSVVYRATKFARRHKVGVAMAALLGLAAVGSVVALSRGATIAQRGREEAEAVTAFLSNMLDTVSPDERGGGREVLVRQVLDRAGASIGREFADRPLVEARLRHTIGRAYQNLGLHEQADRHLSEALSIRRRELGDRHKETLTILANLAGLRHERGRYDEAAALGLEAIEGFRTIGRGEDPAVFGAMNNLAQTYSRLGRTDEAVGLQEEAVAAQSRRLGAEHPRTLGGMVNLATLYEEQGRLADAEVLGAKALEGWRRAHGEEHPGTLLALHNQALRHMRMKQYTKAEAGFRRVHEARVRVLGEEHPDTLSVLTNLAIVIHRQGRPAVAEPLLIKAWDAGRRVRGEAHPDTLTCATELATIYENAGWPESSRERMGTLVGALRLAAARESATPSDLNSLAWTLLTIQPEALRDPATALATSTKSCERERAAGGKRLWEYLDTLALAQATTGDPTAAAATQREALRLVPKEGEEYREEMEGRLKGYEGAAGAQNKQ